MNDDLNKENLSKKVLARIKDEGVLPRPRFYFVMSNVLFWTLSILSIVIGSFAVAAIIYSVRSIGWQFYAATHHSLLEFAVDSLPYVWLIILALFVILAHQNIRHTKKGYRYAVSAVVVGSIVLSVVCGIGFYKIGIGKMLDRDIGRHVPYLSVSERAQTRWVTPTRGLLAGEVVENSSTSSTARLRDFTGGEWLVDTGDLSEKDLEILEEYQEVRLIGVPVRGSEGVFHACLVFPWDLRESIQSAREASSSGRPALLLLRAAANERNIGAERTTVCKGVEPYELLRQLRE